MMGRSRTVRGLRHRRVVIEGGDVRPPGWRLVRDSCRMGHGKPIEWLAFRAPAFSWLPADLVAFAVVRFRPDLATWESMLFMWARSPAPVAPCGLPLVLGRRRLWRPGYRRIAWMAGVGLGAVTVAGSLVAGLLGPIAIAVYAVLISLPVWIAGWWLRRRA